MARPPKLSRKPETLDERTERLAVRGNPFARLSLGHCTGCNKPQKDCQDSSWEHAHERKP